MKKPQTMFVTFDAASEVTGIPVWKLRKWTWSGRLPSYHPDGPRGRTWIKLPELLALVESSRKPSST